jgi:hypothetical protein
VRILYCCCAKKYKIRSAHFVLLLCAIHFNLKNKTLIINILNNKSIQNQRYMGRLQPLASKGCEVRILSMLVTIGQTTNKRSNNQTI